MHNTYMYVSQHVSETTVMHTFYVLSSVFSPLPLLTKQQSQLLKELADELKEIRNCYVFFYGGGKHKAMAFKLSLHLIPRIISWSALKCAKFTVSGSAGFKVCLVSACVCLYEYVSCSQYQPIQQRMIDHNGSQCGFCTPGMVMNMYRWVVVMVMNMYGWVVVMVKNMYSSHSLHFCPCS